MIHHMLRTSAQRLPEKDAIVQGDDRLSYSQFWRFAAALAGGLRSVGLKRGARLAIFSDASIPQALSIFAASAARAVFVPIHPMLFPEQVAHILIDCEVQGLVTTESRLSALSHVLEQVPALEFVVVTDDAAPECPLPVHDFRSLCRSGTPLEEEAATHDLAAILYTSGSTGRPNGVMLTHAQILAGASMCRSIWA
jgi:acyl-CoA synthetase (AMP-forming)/AMP-acid ligase II